MEMIPMTHRLLRLLLVAAVLAVSACGGSEPTAESATETTGDEDLPFAGDSTETTATGSDGATTVPPPEPEADTTPTTDGSGLPPVTTVPSSAGGDPEGLYRGVIGLLTPDELVIPPNGDPPSLPADVLPLTGQSGQVPNRPAAAVKIDNTSAAVPQYGLQAADLVIEEEVEGGATRLMAVFHSTPSIVGPVRSGRTTDISVIGGLGSPLLMYSGANDVTEGIIRAQPFIQNRNSGSSSGYWRDENRRAPSNMLSDTAPHWESATGGPPPAQFAYRDAGAPVQGTPTEQATITYPASSAEWRWEDDRWKRWQRGATHQVQSGAQVDAANVVVVEVDRVDTGLVDSSGGVVPEFVFVGSGAASVFTAGHRIDGTWTRSTLTSVATFTTADGEQIELTPGRTWIQVVSRGSGALG